MNLSIGRVFLREKHYAELAHDSVEGSIRERKRGGVGRLEGYLFAGPELRLRHLKHWRVEIPAKSVDQVAGAPALRKSPTSRGRASSATAPHLPDAGRRTQHQLTRRRPATRYPRFRRDPFARDVAFDPGGTTMPRIAALHMLRSTMNTVSAPAISSFRGSIPHPTHRLCTLRVRRRRRLTQHSLPGGPLRLYLGRTCTG